MFVSSKITSFQKPLKSITKIYPNTNYSQLILCQSSYRDKTSIQGKRAFKINSCLIFVLLNKKINSYFTFQFLFLFIKKEFVISQKRKSYTNSLFSAFNRSFKNIQTDSLSVDFMRFSQ